MIQVGNFSCPDCKRLLADCSVLRRIEGQAAVTYTPFGYCDQCGVAWMLGPKEYWTIELHPDSGLVEEQMAAEKAIAEG